MSHDRFLLPSRLQPLLPQAVLSATAAVVVALDVLVSCNPLQGVPTGYNCNTFDFSPSYPWLYMPRFCFYFLFDP
jgi:hypothetical protein